MRGTIIAAAIPPDVIPPPPDPPFSIVPLLLPVLFGLGSTVPPLLLFPPLVSF